MRRQKRANLWQSTILLIVNTCSNYCMALVVHTMLLKFCRHLDVAIVSIKLILVHLAGLLCGVSESFVVKLILDAFYIVHNSKTIT